MRWIALSWQLEAAPAVPGEKAHEFALPPREALGWWALQFSPRVTWLDEALLIEVSACERLWGGPRALAAELQSRNPAPEARMLRAQGDTSLSALARLRLTMAGQRPPADIPAGLPLHTLTVARPHLDMLERLGCRRWGDVERLPRAGLARRFGMPLRTALDHAWGRLPEVHLWLELPEQFDQKAELPALAERAPELLWSAGRLLRSMQIWLRARQRGVLAFELQWTLDLKRIDGIDLPPFEQITLRTSEPVQETTHLQRLLGERLAQQKMAAPASWLRLRSLETTPWGGSDTSFLPEDNRRGDALHQLVERLSARLGDTSVLTAVPQADHRPDAMQRWLPARDHLSALKTGAVPAKAAKAARTSAPTTATSAIPAMPVMPSIAKIQVRSTGQPDALYPGWLLPDPLRLEIRQGRPWWRGLLQPLAGPHRVETGWWNTPQGAPPQRVLRDYYIAESPAAGLVWIFQERDRPPAADAADAGDAHAPDGSWFLHGLYA